MYKLCIKWTIGCIDNTHIIIMVTGSGDQQLIVTGDEDVSDASDVDEPAIASEG